MAPAPVASGAPGTVPIDTPPSAAPPRARAEQIGGGSYGSQAGASLTLGPGEKAAGASAPADPGAMSESQLAELRQLCAANFAALEASGFDYSDISTMLGKLMIEFAQQQRESAMNQRSLGYEKAKGDLLSQAAEQEQAAAKMKQGATVSMAVGLVSAAVSVVTSGVSLGGQVRGISKAGGAMKNIETAQSELTEVTNASKFAKGIKSPRDFTADIEYRKANVDLAKGENEQLVQSTQRFVAVGQIGESVGGMGRTAGGGADGLLQAEGKTDEAEGSRYAAEATAEQQKADAAKEIQQAVDDMVRQIIAFIKDLQDSELEMMRAVTR